MIDITCPACNITYHADETHLGRGFRCKVCGKIIRVEHPELAPIPLREVVQATTSKQRVGRDRQVGAGILVLGTLLVGAWLILRSPDEPHHIDVPEFKLSPPVERLEMPKEKPLRPFIIRTKKAVPKPVNLQPVVVVPKCAEGQKPEELYTGERIEQDEGTSGQSMLEITNGLREDAAVRLLDNSTNQTARFVYIRANDSYTIEGIEPSNYALVFASGSDWIPACGEFQRDEEIQEFEKPLQFEESDEKRTRYRVTLHPVLNGNIRANKIDRKRFLQGDQHFTLPPQ